MLLITYQDGPTINLDHETGTWRLATDAEVPPGVALVNVPGIVGDYLVIEGLYHYRYWTDVDTPQERFFFRTDEDVLIEIDGHRYAEVVYATDPAGNPQPDHKQFSIYREDGQLLYRIIYYSLDFEKQYQYDLMTGDTEQYTSEPPTLGTWDWFVACVGSFDLMKRRRLEREQEAKTAPPPPAPDVPPVLSALPGQPCPQGGVWFAPNWNHREVTLETGETMPGGRDQGAVGTVIWYLKRRA